MVRVKQIGPGQRDLHRAIGERPDELQLVHGEGAASPERPEDGRVPDLGGGDIQGLHLRGELLRVIDQGQQVGQRDELAVVEARPHEARIIVAPLLAVGDDVNAGPELRVDGQAHGVVGRRLELLLGETPLHVLVDGLDHPARPRPASDPHDGQRRNDRRGSGSGQRGRDGDGNHADGRREHRSGRRWRDAAPARRAPPCTRGSCGRGRPSSTTPARFRSSDTRRENPPPPRGRWTGTRGGHRAATGPCAGGSAAGARCRSRDPRRRSGRRPRSDAR